MNSRFSIFAFALLTYTGTSHADELELTLEKCLSGPAQVTDIEFIAPHYAFMTTQLGDIYRALRQL
jgi:hypothetical protein